MYKENPKMKGSGMLGCIPQQGPCPIGCEWCFFNERSYLDIMRETPNMPGKEESEGRVVRVNDGGDSSVNWPLSLISTRDYKDKFYNTSQVDHLREFDAPIVLTVNPGKMTDEDFWIVSKEDAEKIMFVRFRVNTWNLELMDKCIRYYMGLDIPTVATPMAYPSLMPIPQEEIKFYEWGKRTLNDYWKLNMEGKKKVCLGSPMGFYYCEGECKRCGNCLREYFRKKEELNATI